MVGVERDLTALDCGSTRAHVRDGICLQHASVCAHTKQCSEAQVDDCAVSMSTKQGMTRI